MRIAVISDTHDNLQNIKKIVGWLNKEKIMLLLHCGDICSSDTLKEGFNDFLGEVRLVLGNADFEDVEDYDDPPKFIVFKEFGKIITQDKKIAFTHFFDAAKNLAENGEYDIVFYGHTHKPCLVRRSLLARRSFSGGGGEGGGRKIKECLLVNPGEAAGLFYKATFAIYDTEDDRLELKLVEELEI